MYNQNELKPGDKPTKFVDHINLKTMYEVHYLLVY